MILQAKLAQETYERLQSSNPDEKKNALSTLSGIAEVCLMQFLFYSCIAMYIVTYIVDKIFLWFKFLIQFDFFYVSSHPVHSTSHPPLPLMAKKSLQPIV